ncbi:MAG: type IX secretion system membrane protein PorP/SprF [Bacteroidales bacterium]|nr:type IX secretion system membrane protein PorP/SprF [Bacteroidales bacterium]
MRKLIIVFFTLALGSIAFTQQERQVSHYMYDHISVNPGSAGSTDMISTTVLYRQQWVGMDGAPNDLILNLSAPFKLGSTNHGVGLSIWQDKLGFTTDGDISLSYAYQFSVGGGKLGFGISAIAVNRQLDASWYTGAAPFHLDPDFDGGIPEESQNEMKLDMGFGLFYQTDELYMGISSSHLLESEFAYSANASGGSANEKMIRHYYLTAGYNLSLSNPLLEFQPSVFVQTDAATTKIDINATLMYNKKFWGGVSYRVGSAVIGMVGINILNGVRVGYAYDFDTSPLVNVSSGSHEVMIGYSFTVGVEKIPQKYKSIRYL